MEKQMQIDLSVNEKYMEKITKAPHYYDEDDLADWKRWAEKWASLDWKDSRDS